MKHIQDIFFDLDHTLWDFDTNSHKAFDKIFKEEHRKVNVDVFINHYVTINQYCWKLYQNNQITHDELRYMRLKNTFEAINYTIDDTEILRISSLYIEYLPQSNVLFENTFDTLDYLQTKYKLHIITNGFALVQEKKLKNSGLEKYFLTITNSELAGAKKPNRTIFEYAINSAKTQYQNSLMVGDCLEADIEGAKKVGMEAIWFNPQNLVNFQNIKAVKNLVELKNIL